MRITENMRVATSLAAVSRSVERVAKLSAEASSGQRIAAPSDDAVGYGAIVSADARVSSLASRSATVTNAAGDLDLAESSLASAGDLLVRAHEIALQGVDGSTDPATRANLGAELTQIRSSLLGIANTQGSSGYIFGGTRTDVAPFDSAGAFVGNAASRSVTIADGSTGLANASGANAFTSAGGQDVFASLQSLATALTTNNVAAIQTGLGQMDGANRQVLAARIDAGLSSERLHSAADVTNSALNAIKTARAATSDADPTQVYSDLEAAKNAYEQGISVTRELLSIAGAQRA